MNNENNYPNNNNQQESGREGYGQYSYGQSYQYSQPQQPSQNGYTRVQPDGQYRYIPQQHGAQSQPQSAPSQQNAAPQSVPIINNGQPGSGYTVRSKPTVSTAKNTGFAKYIVGIAIGVAASLIIGLSAGAVINSSRTSGVGGSTEILVAQSPVTETVVPTDNTTRLTYAQIASKVRSGVVGITVYSNTYGWGNQVYSQGSGFIISKDGYIVTNSHVIDDDNSSSLKLTATITDMDGNNKELEVKLIGYDVVTDLAVLKFDPAGVSFTVCELGQSTALVPGDEVVAIGNPGGAQFAGSVTNGIVSGIDRVIDEKSGASETAMKYIQTNAAINPGNSGGPLLNMYGQVIGINTSKIVASGYEGLGFSIPMETAKPIFEQLIEHGHVSRPALGVTLQEISAQTAAWYDVPQGLLIRSITASSGLNGTNIKTGDIITAIDGTETTTLTELQNVLYKHKIGDTITLTMFRPGEEGTFEVTAALIADDEISSNP